MEIGAETGPGVGVAVGVAAGATTGKARTGTNTGAGGADAALWSGSAVGKTGAGVGTEPWAGTGVDIGVGTGTGMDAGSAAGTGADSAGGGAGTVALAGADVKGEGAAGAETGAGLPTAGGADAAVDAAGPPPLCFFSLEAFFRAARIELMVVRAAAGAALFTIGPLEETEAISQHRWTWKGGVEWVVRGQPREARRKAEARPYLPDMTRFHGKQCYLVTSPRVTATTTQLVFASTRGE